MTPFEIKLVGHFVSIMVIALIAVFLHYLTKKNDVKHSASWDEQARQSYTYLQNKFSNKRWYNHAEMQQELEDYWDRYYDYIPTKILKSYYDRLEKIITNRYYSTLPSARPVAKAQ